MPLQGGSLLFLLMVTSEAGQPGTEAGQQSETDARQPGTKAAQSGTETAQPGTEASQKCQLLLATDQGNNPL